jgi:catechol 2,3-dioxygenase-like lactoylglutathione lyase family enzyme
VLGHVGVNVPDLAAARRYYSVIMPLVEFEMYLDADDQFAYRPAAGKPGTYLFFYPSAEQSRYPRHRTGLQHLAFMVRTRSAVKAVAISAAVLRDLLARPVGLHARSGMPLRPRLTPSNEIRCANPIRPTVPA